jgi:hypothetical protein
VAETLERVSGSTGPWLDERAGDLAEHNVEAQPGVAADQFEGVDLLFAGRGVDGHAGIVTSGL